MFCICKFKIPTENLKGCITELNIPSSLGRFTGLMTDVIVEKSREEITTKKERIEPYWF